MSNYPLGIKPKVDDPSRERALRESGFQPEDYVSGSDFNRIAQSLDEFEQDPNTLGFGKLDKGGYSGDAAQLHSAILDNQQSIIAAANGIRPFTSLNEADTFYNSNVPTEDAFFAVYGGGKILNYVRKASDNSREFLYETLDKNTLLKSYFIGSNLFNINDAGVRIDNTIYSNGNIGPSTGSNVTHPIPVDATIDSNITISEVRGYRFNDVNGANVGNGTFAGDTRTLTIPATAVTLEFAVVVSSDDWSNLMVNYGDSLLPFKAYEEFPEQINEQILVKTSSLVEDVVLGQVVNKVDKASYAQGYNLFDKDNTDILQDTAVFGNGNFGASTGSTTSYLIDIDSVANDFISINQVRGYVFKNASGSTLSSGTFFGDPRTIPIPTDAATFRFAVSENENIDDTMLVYGEFQQTFKPFEEFPQVVSGVKTLSSGLIVDKPLDNFALFLPKEVCVAVGRTIELYNNEVSKCGNINNYHFAWSGIGKNMKRKCSITGTSGNVGNHTLTLKVYDNNNVQIAEKSTTVKIASAIINTPFSLTAICDSNGNRKPWQGELVSLSSNQIDLVGTRSFPDGSYGHEGRSGATAGYYLGNNSYTFDSNGIAGNDGRTQDLNPFFNPTLGDVDFDYYKSNYNQNPDKLLIWLGTNGLAVDPTTNVSNIRAFIDKIRATGGATIPIFVCHTIFKSNQDGIGAQTSNDGFTSVPTYKYLEDIKVFNLQVALLENLENEANTYLVPLSTCHDSDFNYGAVSTPVNPRASQTELLPVESVHPQTQGYYQIADIIFSSLAVNQ
ncbi:hypothetical protein [Nonlabens dokdonensis]|uniref:hypothetical protein n=1 Tax=Nonlabens dokdonensis TaxID=328515 RepID=UPI0026EB7522|nr:hypothetical protein [Nonlabens dokdonensis]